MVVTAVMFAGGSDGLLAVVVVCLVVMVVGSIWASGNPA